MKDECVVGVYDSLPKAELAVRILKKAGFGGEKISVVASCRDLKPGLREELKIGDDSLRDAAIGVGLGGILGVLAGLGLAAFPLAGAMIFLVGPLAGAATGTVVGGLVGGMIGWGVRKDQIEHYEEAVRAGKPLVVVNGDPVETAHAEQILRETDALEVHLHARTESDSPEVRDAKRTIT